MVCNMQAQGREQNDLSAPVLITKVTFTVTTYLINFCYRLVICYRYLIYL